jgi:hypothetical protein
MRLTVFIITLLFLFGSNVMAEGLTIPEDKTVIEFDSKTGNVTFAHRKHAELRSTQCTTCHHKHQPTDIRMQPCHECHLHKAKKAFKKPPKAKKAFHTRCIGCHEYTVADGQASGPVKKKCILCHIR